MAIVGSNNVVNRNSVSGGLLRSLYHANLRSVTTALT